VLFSVYYHSKYSLIRHYLGSVAADSPSLLLSALAAALASEFGVKVHPLPGPASVDPPIALSEPPALLLLLLLLVVGACRVRATASH
jgi:hypothetical protein